MTLTTILKSLPDLVALRETVENGTLRCLFSPSDPVDDGDVRSTIGCDELSRSVERLDPDVLSEDDVSSICSVFCGENVYDYIDPESDDQLWRLDALIDAVRNILP